MTVNRLRCWMGLIVLLLVCSCALTGTRRDVSAELLAKDYASMSDQELQTYYSQLSDQIAKVQRSTSLSKGAGATNDSSAQTVVENLRDRWNEVRTELRRRGLRQ